MSTLYFLATFGSLPPSPLVSLPGSYLPYGEGLHLSRFPQFVSRRQLQQPLKRQHWKSLTPTFIVNKVNQDSTSFVLCLAVFSSLIVPVVCALYSRCTLAPVELATCILRYITRFRYTFYYPGIYYHTVHHPACISLATQPPFAERNSPY